MILECSKQDFLSTFSFKVLEYDTNLYFILYEIISYWSILFYFILF